MRLLFSILSLMTAFSLSAAQSPNLPDGYRAEVVVTGLRGPTQMSFGPDGRLYIAQLAGGENAGTGQVVAVDAETGEATPSMTGVTFPQHLPVDGDTLLASSFADGAVYRISEAKE